MRKIVCASITLLWAITASGNDSVNATHSAFAFEFGPGTSGALSLQKSLSENTALQFGSSVSYNRNVNERPTYQGNYNQTTSTTDWIEGTSHSEFSYASVNLSVGLRHYKQRGPVAPFLQYGAGPNFAYERSDNYTTYPEGSGATVYNSPSSLQRSYRLGIAASFGIGVLYQIDSNIGILGQYGLTANYDGLIHRGNSVTKSLGIRDFSSVGLTVYW